MLPALTEREREREKGTDQERTDKIVEGRGLFASTISPQKEGGRKTVSACGAFFSSSSLSSKLEKRNGGRKMEKSQIYRRISLLPTILSHLFRLAVGNKIEERERDLFLPPP